jgi:predicted ATPase
MTVKRIVVTGGPCGGKSTALSYIKKTAEAHGFCVLTVGETATELISGGVAPWTCATNATYQGFQIALQMYKEEIFLAAGATMNAEKLLLVCDRGLLDNRAYMTEEEFLSCLAARGDTPEEYLSRYDAVFHLVTAAKGADAFYTTANNAARTETPDEARRVDERLLYAWKEHPRRYVLENNGSFADKMERLTEALEEVLKQ